MQLQIRIDSGKPVQYIPENLSLPCEVISFKTHENPSSVAKDFVQAQIEMPFDIIEAPLFRACLVEVSDNECWYVLIGHHLIMDGWCYSLAKKELAALYNRLVHPFGNKVDYEHGFLQSIEDYSNYFTSQSYQDSRDFWLDQYETLPDRIVCKQENFPDNKKFVASEMLSVPIEANKLNSLRKFSTALKITPSQLFIAIFYAYFSRIKNTSMIAFGVPSHNRKGARLKQTLGMFASIVPMVFNFDKDISFEELCVEIGRLQRKFLRHQRYPASHLNRDLKLGEIDRSEVYDVCINYLPFDYEVEFNSLDTESHHLNNGHNQTPIDFTIKDFGENLDGILEMNFSPLYWSQIEAGLFISRFFYVVDQLYKDPSIKISTLSLTPPDETRKLLFEFNNEGILFDIESTVVERFETIVRKFPQKDAVIFGEHQISYDDLEKHSRNFAKKLIDLNIKPDNLVCICMDRSIEMVIAILAILRAGAGYIPIDPLLPERRIETMLSDADPLCVLIDSTYRSKLGAIVNNLTIPLFDENSICDQGATGSDYLQSTLPKIAPSSISYAMYTSGSTGTPKAVLIEHGTLMNQLDWMISEYSVDQGDIILHKTPITFDVSVWEIFLPLVIGGTMIIAKPGGHGDPDYLCDLIREHSVTLLEFVPSLLRLVVENNKWSACSSLRVVLSGGEALTPDIVTMHCKNSSARLDNTYGPTEATITVSQWMCHKTEQKRIPIGKPIRNAQFYVLDFDYNLAPIGEVGQLFIGGNVLARGYLNREKLTNEKFFNLVLSNNESVRVYATGDLVRWTINGDLEYISRMDNQIKLRGQRLEIDEVELSIIASGLVKTAAVMLQKTSNGSDCLVAYVVKNTNIKNTDDSDFIRKINDYLMAHLPSFMIPSGIFVLDEVPFTSSGKVDKKRIQLIELKDSVKAYCAPTNYDSQVIASLWGEVLAVSRIGMDDDFFILGGDSLSATRMMAQLGDRLGANLPLNIIFEKSILSDFSKEVEDFKRTNREMFYPSKIKTNYPFLDNLFLSPNQRDSFKTFDENRNKFISYSLIKESIEDIGALRSALDEMVKNNDGLRVRSIQENDSWIQVVGEESNYGFYSFDIIEMEPSLRNEFIRNECKKICGTIDISSGLLISLAAFILNGDNDAYVFVVAHHSVCDAISSKIIYSKLISNYSAVKSGVKIISKNSNSYYDYCKMWEKYYNSDSFFNDLNEISAHLHKRIGYQIQPDFHTEFIGRDGRAKYFKIANVKDSFFNFQSKVQESIIVSALAKVFSEEWSLPYIPLSLMRHGRAPIVSGYDFGSTIGWFAMQLPVWISAHNLANVCDIPSVMNSIKNEEKYLHAYNLEKSLHAQDLGALNNIVFPEVVINFLGNAEAEIKDKFFYDRSEILRSIPISSEKVINNYKFFIMIELSKHENIVEIDWQYSSAQYYEPTISYLSERFKIEFLKNVDLYVSQYLTSVV